LDKLDENGPTIDFTRSELKDFGFTFEEDLSNVSVTELEELQALVKKQEKSLKVHDAVARELIKRVISFTNNLKRSPEKPTINWPNRVESIDKWVAELHEIYAKIKE
jgi:hypothetical protein